jgi:hypothetical protein
MENHLKIMTVSLIGEQKHKAFGVFNGERLVITAVIPIQGGLLRSWKKSLIAEIQEKKKSGYMILVEEKTDLIARHATRYMLEEIEEGSNNLFEALDSYFGLSDMVWGTLLCIRIASDSGYGPAPKAKRFRKSRMTKAGWILHLFPSTL